MIIMKVLLAILIALCVTYFFLDRQLYFYGKNDFEIYHPLPINVKPQYWGYDLGNIGFVLVDNFDFVVVGKGTKYKSSELIVDEIIKYGFDKEKIVVTVSDSVRREYVATLQSKDRSEIHVSLDNQKDINEFSWIEIKGSDSYTKRIGLIRNYAQIAFVILIFVVGYLLIKRRIKYQLPNKLE